MENLLLLRFTQPKFYVLFMLLVFMQNFWLLIMLRGI